MSDLTDFDRLVEQQDQEIALTGEVSPFTRLQLEALANGKPVPHVWESPAVQEATARLLKGSQMDEDEWFFDN